MIWTELLQLAADRATALGVSLFHPWLQDQNQLNLILTTLWELWEILWFSSHLTDCSSLGEWSKTCSYCEGRTAANLAKLV